MEWAGYLASACIGFVLGVVGGGGSLLAIPVLIYCFGIAASSAPTYSLFIVFLASAVASIRNISRKKIDLPALLFFGIPSMAVVVLMRTCIVPLVPVQLHVPMLGEIAIDFLYALAFALLMILSALTMLKPPAAETERQKRLLTGRASSVRLTGMALVTGSITGISGIGGGFLIVPSLVIASHIPLQKAIGTSLAIICINAGVGFCFSPQVVHLNTPVLLGISAMAVAGIFLGLHLAERLPVQWLKRGFACLLLAMALLLLIAEGVRMAL